MLQWLSARARIRLTLALLLGAALVLAGCGSESIRGPAAGPYTIVEIFDGDSFNLKAANGSIVRVRIAGIDAPEKSQPYAQKAKESLAFLLTTGEIRLVPLKVDRYDRWVAHVSVGTTDVGLVQIERGFAWFFTRYRRDLDDTRQSRYAHAEQRAREQRLGLWAGLDASRSNPTLAPEAPWKFRERTRKEK